MSGFIYFDHKKPPQCNIAGVFKFKKIFVVLEATKSIKECYIFIIVCS